jgi:hypothetical protein
LKERSKELLFPGLLAVAAFLFFARRARFGLYAIGFNDEVMHLLGGWALDSGERLYRDFVDQHGPGIFMLAQLYGALFGFAHANNARLVIAGFAVIAGAAVASTPALRGPQRALGAALYFGLLAGVWLVQGLYWFSYYPLSGALAVMILAWFTIPACVRARIPAAAAAAAGAASAGLAFTSYSEAPSALLFSLGGCLAAWFGGQWRAASVHLIAACAVGFLLLGWMLVWGDVRGYLTFHVLFSQTAYLNSVHVKIFPVSLPGLIWSLTPSLQPDRLVQSAAILCGAFGSAASLWLALRPGRGRAACCVSVVTTLAALVLLDARGLVIFQNGAMLMAAIGVFALAMPAAVAPVTQTAARPLLWASALCLCAIVCNDAVLRHAIYSPTTLTRAQFLGQPPAGIALRGDAPLDVAIRRLTRPGERILALVYRPDIYWAAGRLPINRLYEYLPADALYAHAPMLGEQRDLCAILDKSPPPVIVFDNWVVWGTYKPIDYMPCLFKVLAAKYTYIPEAGDEGAEAAKLYVRNDRVPG